MKKVLSLILCMAIVLYTCGLFADAAVPESERTVTVFPDGSYCITTITVEPSESAALYAASSDCRRWKLAGSAPSCE